jgi:hypothetical protein
MSSCAGAERSRGAAEPGCMRFRSIAQRGWMIATKHVASSAKASAEVGCGSAVVCIEARQPLCVGKRCESCVTPKQRNLRENGPVELGSYPWRSPTRATRQLVSRLLRARAQTPLRSVSASSCRRRASTSTTRPDLRKKSGMSKRCTSAHRPSAAAATWSFACAGNSSRSCSHSARSFSAPFAPFPAHLLLLKAHMLHCPRLSLHIGLRPHALCLSSLIRQLSLQRTHAFFRSSGSIAPMRGGRLDFQHEERQMALELGVSLTCLVRASDVSGCAWNSSSSFRCSPRGCFAGTRAPSRPA